MRDPIRELLEMLGIRPPRREPPEQVRPAVPPALSPNIREWGLKVPPRDVVPPLVRFWGASVRDVLDGDLTVAVLCECCAVNDAVAATRYLWYVEATHRGGEHLPHFLEAA